MTNVILRRRKLGRGSTLAIQEASRQGLRAIRNDSPQIGDIRPSILFRWGCTSQLQARTTVNTCEAIARVADKAGFREILGDLAPETWRNREQVRFPCVVRPLVHHQGRHLYVCNDPVELSTAIARCTGKSGGWYASPLIDKVAEYRVFVVSGRAVCVARKHPGNPDQVAWNVFQGGRFENVPWDEWPLKAVKISIQAFALSGLDFGGVDVMVDREGGVYVLEINSAPSLTSPYRQRCFAKAFDYIIEHGKTVIPLQQARGNYRKFIHPSIINHQEVV